VYIIVIDIISQRISSTAANNFTLCVDLSKHIIAAGIIDKFVNDGANDVKRGDHVSGNPTQMTDLANLQS
jgi:hypothetical protein